MRKHIFVLFLFFYTISAYSQENTFFMKLADKELATFNDGITLMRLLYNENEENVSFIDNIIWAVEKKLFKVTLPITDDQINPVLTRREFAYWICKVFNTKGGLVNNNRVIKYSAYKRCVNLGIIYLGRGPYDSFTGGELLDCFSYLDYYVRANNVKARPGVLENYDDQYRGLPEWRERMYQKIEEQREKRKELREQRRKEKREKIKKEMKNKERPDKLIEKVIEE